MVKYHIPLNDTFHLLKEITPVLDNKYLPELPQQIFNLWIVMEILNFEK